VTDDRQFGLDMKMKRGPKPKPNFVHPLDEIIFEVSNVRRRWTKNKPIDLRWLELLKIEILMLKVRHPELSWPVIPWEDFPKTPRMPKLVEDRVEPVADKIESEPDIERQPELPLTAPVPEKGFTKVNVD
jgi:hypothetical protein